MDPDFYVGDIPVFGDTILAPMAGFADIPHRKICRGFGSSLSYTEFVATENILSGSKRSIELLKFTEEERPVVLQVFGNNAQLILSAAQRIEALGPDIIDVNMGCSTRRVSGRGAGVGMMPELKLVEETFSQLSRNLKVQVSGKIRLGWDRCQNYLEVARVMEDNGVSLIAMHARTREQKYGGEANWDAIALLKQSTTVPIIGNGDVCTPEDVDQMKAYTGCDAVMIGRAAIGNPWIFAREKKQALLLRDVTRMIRRHLQDMLDYYGQRGLILFRKYVQRYLQDMPLLDTYRSKLVQMGSVSKFEKTLFSLESVYGGQTCLSLGLEEVTRSENRTQSTLSVNHLN